MNIHLEFRAVDELDDVRSFKELSASLRHSLGREYIDGELHIRTLAGNFSHDMDEHASVINSMRKSINRFIKVISKQNKDVYITILIPYELHIGDSDGDCVWLNPIVHQTVLYLKQNISSANIKSIGYVK